MTNIQSAATVRNEIKQGLAWYLVQCKPNAERVAVQNLSNQGFNSFLPLQKLTNRRAQTFQTPLRPLFPGYLFVEINASNVDWRKINSTRGIVRLVRFSLYPHPVPASVMQSLFANCNEGNIFEPEEVLKAGDRIQVTQGPFTGFAAKIAEISSNKRIYMLLEIMGQTSTIAIPHDHLSKLN
jgi:transcriptional antiterminator RfaH